MNNVNIPGVVPFEVKDFNLLKNEDKVHERETEISNKITFIKRRESD